MIQRSLSYVTNFLHTQLFLTLISMPVLIHWGLPISLMTLVGNFVFAPMLALVILLSSLLFFTELLSVPNSAIAYGLTVCIEWWHTLLSFGSSKWLIEQTHPGIVWLICIPGITLVGLMHPRCRFIRASRMRQLWFMLIIIGLNYGLLWLKTQCSAVHDKTPIHQLCTTTKAADGTIILHDAGYFNQITNADNAIRFTIKPYLARVYGTSLISRVELEKASCRSFTAAAILIEQCSVKQITIPYFDTLQPKGWKAFFKLKEVCRKNNCTIIRVQQPCRSSNST